ncbi:T9SS type A sorting domain-containing protein [Runella aurantiaca]|uniref:T9SS C-terminal target domain-containing protein n=1 Tax=Runella aurantiaca TaxID=2282308 RepID=A0A369I327_9BACT|nr:T9SS type A sorting domain-containing protein [Runella aurantiaca]RDB03958.1 T9SS C-terminal target domain-containing protein [Runella aurantiaca]
MKYSFLLTTFLWVVGVSLYAQNQLTAIKHLVNTSSNPRKFVRLENKVFFIANTNQQGDEWWVTDGTETGTQLLKDVVPGVGSGLYYANDLPINPTVVADGKFYFTSLQADGQCAVWQSDGTPNGTVRLTQWGVAITELMPLNGQLYIADKAQKIWVLNPSTLASTQLAELGLGKSGAGFFPHNGKMYFNNSGRSAVFQTDGTTTGTIRVGYFGSFSSEPKMFVWRDYLYYYCNALNDGHIVRIKNNNPATAEVVYARGFANPNTSLSLSGVIEMQVKEDKIQIVEHINFDSPSVRLLESTDGYNFRTIDKTASPALASNFLWIDAKFYGISKKGTLVIRDFEKAGTTEVADAWKVIPDVITTLKKVGNSLLVGGSTAADVPKWYNLKDGTLAEVAVAPSNYELLADAMVHSGRLAANSDTELYKTDLTTLKSNMVKNIKTVGNDDFEIIRVGKKVFFLTRDEATAAASTSLWITDGTISGTTKVKDIPSISVSKVLSTYQDGAHLYLQTQTDSNESAIWVSDGTPEGTKELKRFAGKRTEPMKVVVWEKRRMFLHPHVSFIYDIDSKNAIDFKVGSNDNLGIDSRQLSNKVLIKVDYTLYSVDFDGKLTVLDASGLIPLQTLAATSNKVFYNRFIRFDFSIGEPTIALMATDGTLEGTKEVSRSLYGGFSVQALKTDVLVTYTSAATPTRILDAAIVNENTLTLRRVMAGGARQIVEIFMLDDMAAFQLDNGRFFALNPRTASVTELSTLAYSDKVIVHEGELYIVGQNCRRINLKTLETSLLLPQDDRYTRVFSFFQDGRDLYLSWDGRIPQTWLIRQTEVRKLGEFVLNQRPLAFNGRKALMVSKTGYPPIMLYTADSLATQLAYVRDVVNNGEEGWGVFNNYLVVSSLDTQAGVEPWTTDGTPENSRILDDLQPTIESSFPSRYLVIDGKRLICIAEAGAMGKQLWALRSPILAVEPPLVNYQSYLYPNPASTHFTVISKVPFEPASRLLIYNSIGQIIGQHRLPNNATQVEIGLENIVTGMYFVTIDAGLGKRVSHKLVVIR